MPGPQSPYPHPGPSNYYGQPPPPMPPYPYPVMSPHGPPPYPYGYPPSPMNGHSPIPPSSPRVGPGRGGYRGGPSPAYHQGYHHPHPHQHQQHQHPPYMHGGPHVQMHSPQPSPTSPYPHHGLQKYPPPHTQPAPYSPSYPPTQQPNGPYPQNWSLHGHQPISPLPKQLGIPPAPSLSPLIPPILPPRDVDETIAVETRDATHSSSSSSPSAPEASPKEAVQTSITEPPELSPLPPPPPDIVFHHPSSRSSSRPQSPSSITSVTPSMSASATGNTASTTHKSRSWVIWSRRPTDPTGAPGVIISPRARPPAHVVDDALILPTPPQSPKPQPVAVAKLDDIPVGLGSPPVTDSVHSPPNEQPEVLSSSATDVSTSPDTPVPGSPLSTNTSVSLAAATPAKSGSKSRSPVSPKAALLPPATEVDQDTKDPGNPAPVAETDPAPAEVLPPAPGPPAPKKLWASLFTPAAGSASSPKTTGSLPTSSVVGFSISASPPSARVPPVRRAELIKLLTSFPPPPSASLRLTTAPIPRIRPRGIVNTGNMCFANSVLQLLTYCPPFWRLFGELGRNLSIPEGKEKDSRELSEGGTPLVDATIRFLQEFVYEEKKPVNGTLNGRGRAKEVEREEEADTLDFFIPSYVYDAMKEKKRFDNMRGGQQEDAEEFFGFYLDTLEEELLSLLSTVNPSQPAPVKITEEREEDAPRDVGWMEVGKRNKTVLTRTVKSTDSPITRIFGGKFRSTVRAREQRDSVVIEDWRSLQLDIQRDSVRTIQDALSHISQPQAVQMASSTRPDTTVEASQQILIEALPPVLVLHLKRFLYDVTAKGVVKIGKAVAFSPELEIPQDIMAPGKRSTRPERYQLYGVLYHHGLSATGGHYTLDVLHPNRDATSGPMKPREAWIRIDDELVSDIRPEDVFDGLDRDDRCAYLLFYRRTGGWART